MSRIQNDRGLRRAHSDYVGGSPRKLSRDAWKLVFRLTFRGFITHGLIDMAASLTYYGVLALAPSLVALVSLGATFGDGRKSADALLASIQTVAPGSALTLLRAPLEKFGDSPAVGYALIGGLAVAIWATSSFVAAFGRSLNRIYEIPEGRPIWKLKPFQILVALVVIVLVLITITVLVLSGPVTAGLGQALNIGQTPVILWSILKWPLLVAAVALAVAILYYATPNVRQPRFRWISGGALLTVIVLTAASVLFAIYAKDFAHYDNTYRSFAGIVIILVWLWIVNLTLVFGAEFDAQVERARELEAGVPAERKIQLEPRNTEASDRAARSRERSIRDGERLRRRHDEGSTP